MALPFSWSRLRPHLDSVQAAFEQLCSQLFHQTDREKKARDGWRFFRNGRPDGGVECYWRHPNGGVHGLQAKFHPWALGPSQWKQLDQSIEHALSAYPNLRSMIIALPQDLPQSPGLGPRTARARWEQWCQKWTALAQKRHQQLTFELWGQHELFHSLASPENQGLRRYFFDDAVLTQETMLAQLRVQTAAAGPRYHPEVHVNSSLESLFQWLVQSVQHRQEVRAAVEPLVKRIADPELSSIVQREVGCTEQWNSVVSSGQNAIDATCVPGHTLLTALREFEKSCATALTLVEEHEPPRTSWQRPATATDAATRKKWETLRPIAETIEGALRSLSQLGFDQWLDVADRSVLITGPGGCGKTHLFCRMAATAAAANCPAAMVFGMQIDATRFWPGVMQGLGDFGDHREFLGALDAAAQVADCRALLLIDALNEAGNNHRWAPTLRAVTREMEAYPNVCLVLSVRNAYLDWVRPEDCRDLATVHHHGFAGNLRVALDRYVDHFNITAPSVPMLNPELANPLFVSMLCQAIAGSPDPKHERPPIAFEGGAATLSSVFDRFLEYRDAELCEQLSLDRDEHDKPLVAAVQALAREMASSPMLECPLPRCKAILAQFLQGEGAQANIVTLLESASILLRVPRFGPRGARHEVVQFAFDRMSAHFTVRELLRPFASAGKAAALFRPRGALASLAAADDATRHPRAASLAEALFLQWTELFGEELFDTVPAFSGDSRMMNAYCESLACAAPEHFGERSRHWLLHALAKAGSDRSEFLPTVTRLLSRVDHPSLVAVIHEYLAGQSLAQRDAWWTTGLSFEQGSLSGSPLLSWPLAEATWQLEPPTVCAGATALAWLTTTTVPSFRAAATRAMTALLERNLTVAEALLHRFAAVNDPYVLESVVCAVYGACMRSRDSTALRRIAAAVCTRFADGKRWPVHVTIRHALAGIVELAAHRDPTWRPNLKPILPPYKSAWPRRVPGWAGAIKMSKEFESRERFGLRTIISSCLPEGITHDGKPGPGMYGDFGRYVVSSACGPFRRLAYRSGTERGPFSHDFPHRFILNRVLQLGWTSERFEQHDGAAQGASRYDNAQERVGKKYQRIALAEFLARAADRFPLYESSGLGYVRTGYRGPWQVYGRLPIDGTLIRLHSDADEHCDRWWSAGERGGLWGIPQRTRWLLSSQGLPDPRRFLIQTPPGSSVPAAMIGAYLGWKSPANAAIKAGTDNPERQVWMHIEGVCVRRAHLKMFREWLPKITRSTNARPPDPPSLRDSLFGELYWSRAALDGSLREGSSDFWIEADGLDRLPCPMLPLTASYSNESDRGLPRSHWRVPGPWLTEELGLRSGPSEFAFTDRSGLTVAWNPSAREGGADAVFSDLGRLARVAEANDLLICWCVIGEKHQLHDWDDSGPRWPWLAGLYWLENGVVRGSHRVDIDHTYRKRRAAGFVPDTRVERAARAQAAAFVEQFLAERAADPERPRKSRALKKAAPTRPSTKSTSRSKRPRSRRSRRRR